MPRSPSARMILIVDCRCKIMPRHNSIWGVYLYLDANCQVPNMAWPERLAPDTRVAETSKMDTIILWPFSRFL